MPDAFPMAYSYSNWRSEATVAAQIAALKLHMQEVAERIGNEVTGEGFSRGSASLVQYNGQLQAELERLERSPGNRASGGVSRVRLTGPGN